MLLCCLSALICHLVSLIRLVAICGACPLLPCCWPSPVATIVFAVLRAATEASRPRCPELLAVGTLFNAMQAHAPQACIHSDSQQARVASATSGEKWCSSPAWFRPSHLRCPPIEQQTHRPQHYCIRTPSGPRVFCTLQSAPRGNNQAAHAVTLLACKCKCICTQHSASTLNIHLKQKATPHFFFLFFRKRFRHSFSMSAGRTGTLS